MTGPSASHTNASRANASNTNEDAQTQPKSTLHFCSTPRNVLLSIGQAWLDPERQHHLLMIDQAMGKSSPIIDALQTHPGPFKTVITLCKGSGLLGKRRVRRQVFEKLSTLISQLNVDLVFTGNDRRIEFQYAMHRLSRTDRDVTGIYLEDGVNSYLPFHPSHRGLRALADPVVEPLLKKLGYGHWYDRSGAVGCSRWINQRLLTFPNLLQTSGGPVVEQLQATDYTEGKTAEHLSLLVEIMTGRQTRVEGDLLLVLPHSNDLLAQYGSTDAFHKAIYPLLTQASDVRVKYHPNESIATLDGLAEELPRKLPMEMLMSQCRFNRIVGDTSAALLGAKWLQPEARVISVRNERPGSELLFTLMQKAGIEVIDTFAQANS